MYEIGKPHLSKFSKTWKSKTSFTTFFRFAIILKQNWRLDSLRSKIAPPLKKLFVPLKCDVRRPSKILLNFKLFFRRVYDKDGAGFITTGETILSHTYIALGNGRHTLHIHTYILATHCIYTHRIVGTRIQCDQKKIAKCLKKLPKNDFTRKMIVFDIFTKIA